MSEEGPTVGVVQQLSSARALALRMRSLLLRDIPASPVPHAGAGSAGAPDGRGPTGVADVVSWFGAMQAQDLASVLWSLGARLPGTTVGDVEAALERREALRTWPMRGTIHLVPPRDARWMLDLMGVRALAGAGARRAHLGLDDDVAGRAVDVLGEALAGGKRLTRSECVAVLEQAGISGSGQRGYHLLWYASQRGVTCIAPNIGKEQTFVLLDEWVQGDHRRPDRDEALATIAVRYFRSHGPAPRQDFTGWTGLPAADARRGLSAAGERLTTVEVDGREMVLDPAVLDTDLDPAAADPRDDVLALPGFDEYLLGFKDRSLMLAPEHKQAIIPGGNGVFQATIVRAGRVVGTWKRSVSRSRTVVSVLPLVALRAGDRRRVERAMEPYAHFTGRPVEVRWP
jgi:Winged helix DNA-binding domain